MSVSVEIKGLDNLQTKLDNLPQNITNRLVFGVNKAAGIVEGAAKRICPVDSGMLRNSIHVTPAQASGTKVVAKVGTNVEYAMYVEFGTGVRGEATNTNDKYSVSYSSDWAGQAAQPFMMPALENNKDRIERVIDRAVIEGLAK